MDGEGDGKGAMGGAGGVLDIGDGAAPPGGKGAALHPPVYDVQPDWTLTKPGESIWVTATAADASGGGVLHGSLAVSKAQAGEEGAAFEGTDGFSAELRRHANGSRCLAVSNTSSSLATRVVASQHAFDLCSPVLTADVAPGSDGDLGVAGCAGGALEVLSLRTGAPVAKLEGHVLDVLSARFFPSGKVVLSASSDMSLRIWSAEDGRCAAVLRGHTAGVCGTGIIDRGRNVVSCSRDGTVALWDCGTAGLLRAWEMGDVAANACCLLPTALPAGLAVASEPLELHEREVGTDGKVVAVGAQDGVVRLVDLRQPELAAKTTHGDGALLCVTALPAEHAALASGGAAGDVCIWDLRRFESPRTRIASYGGAAVFTVAPVSGHDRASKLWVGTANGACRLWTLDAATEREDGSPEAHLQLGGPSSTPVHAVVDAGTAAGGCSRLVTASSDGRLRVYDCASKWS